MNLFCYCRVNCVYIFSNLTLKLLYRLLEAYELILLMCSYSKHIRSSGRILVMLAVDKS